MNTGCYGGIAGRRRGLLYRRADRLKRGDQVHSSEFIDANELGAGLVRPAFVGFREAEPDLYEFHTESGVYVNLHEMDCIALDYRPLSRQFTATFECLTDTSELMSGTTATLRFDEAEIMEWKDVDPTSPTKVDDIGDPRVRGQVSWMDTIEQPDGMVTFFLGLFDASINFRAATVTCDAYEIRADTQPSDAEG